jgi:hypothetical protein
MYDRTAFERFERSLRQRLKGNKTAGLYLTAAADIKAGGTKHDLLFEHGLLIGFAAGAGWAEAANMMLGELTLRLKVLDDCRKVREILNRPISGEPTKG